MGHHLSLYSTTHGLARQPVTNDRFRGEQHNVNIASEKRLLILLFFLAMVMGSGPGLYLINPNPSDPQASFTFAGLPTIYAWGLLWYAVQLGVILRAYNKYWKRSDNA
jgi:hypothetical protein